MGTDFRDYNNDGLPDILFSALAGQTFPLFRNRGKGQFEDCSYQSRLGPHSIRYSGWGISFGDFDNDGQKDIFSANAHVTDNIGLFSGDKYELPNSIFRNMGDGTFEDISTSAGGKLNEARPHRGLVIADLDNDGRLDAVVTVLGGEPEIWRNVTRTRNHWIAFRLRGRGANRDGIGARIRVGKQFDAQSSARGYASSVLGPLHFGLGAVALVDRVEIVWPSGKTQVLAQVSVDRIVDISEP
jgi:hypothetical protein